VLEWVLTDTFNPSDPAHTMVRHGIERGNGIPALQTAATARAAMQTAGFTLLMSEDLAKRPDPLPWWYPISGDLKSARGVKDWVLVVRNTKWGRVAVRFLVRALELVRVAPKGTTKITEELIISGDSLVAGGKGGLFTPMYLMVGQKGDAKSS
jgi:sterol 24-C-methyltransferase